MIIVKLMGGMGNQMFQYALGRNLSLKYNVPLKIDLSFLLNRNMGPNFVYRNYDLDIFNVYPDFNTQNFGQVYLINEPYFQYSPELMVQVESLIKSGINILLEGYWQTPLYFKDYEYQIRQDFNFRDKVELADSYITEMLGKIINSNSVLINIRRTDYLNTNFHGVMEMNYINQAKSIIESKIENPHYFIFSDDIDWCRQHFNQQNMTIVDHTYKGDRFSYYLQLMSSCKNFIIPNSSFAWWSAWFNTDPNKLVVAPAAWFTDPVINTKDLVPQNWIRI